MVQTVTGNLVEVSSAVRIEIFNGVNVQRCKQVPFDWVHIVDLQKKEIILDSKDMKNSKL